MVKWLADVVRWTGMFYTSVALVLVILLTYFFAPMLSVVLFLALLGLWSRIPAMFSRFTKDLEMIDFLSVMIAINLGAFPAAFFASGLLVCSHFFTRIEYPRYAVVDGIAMFISALVTPLIYSYFSQNLLFTMYAFTIVRYLVRAVFFFTIWAGEFFEMIPIIACNIGLAYLTNTVYIFLFGDFMNQLFIKGLHIHWGFFGIAVIILAFIGSKKWLAKQAAKLETKKHYSPSFLKIIPESFKSFTASSSG